MGKNNYFQFKQFTIVQQHSAMKVGTDGVLLGAWADVSGCKQILDVGAGTGLVALMVTQRSKAQIDAVEIDETAFREACYNVNQSPWSDKVKLYYTSFQSFYPKAQHRYDLIVSNPPYFENSLKAPDSQRAMARHAEGLSFEELVKGSKRLLLPTGRLAVVLPAESGQHFINLAKQEGFSPAKITYVRTTPEKEAARILIDLSLQPVQAITNELTIQHNNSYTPDYRNLTGEFYLDF